VGHEWGKLTQFLVQDEHLVMVVFRHPGSGHHVDHLLVGYLKETFSMNVRLVCRTLSQSRALYFTNRIRGVMNP
jgi:hypothetical protein